MLLPPGNDIDSLASEPAAAGGDADPGAVADALTAIRENAIQLLQAFHRPPSALRIRAAGVLVEAEWAQDVPRVEATSAAVATGSAAPGEPAAGGPVAGGAPAGRGQSVCAPSVGIFYQAPSPGAKPFVTVGDAVSPGDQVAIVEAMKLMIPVTAEVGGTITEVLCADGEPVEYGQPLFAVEVAGRR